MNYYQCTTESGDTHYIATETPEKIMDIITDTLGANIAQTVRGIVPVTEDDIPDGADILTMDYGPHTVAEYASKCPACGMNTNGSFNHCPACNAPMTQAQ